MSTGMAAWVPVDRASPADLMQLATDVGPAPMHVGAVLVLAAGPGFSVAEAQRLLGERVHAVPRLRQRLRRAPPGCGRPFWADDRSFDLRHHVRQLPCPPPGDERALLEVAAAVTGELLPRSRPLWSATFVTGLAEVGGARPPRRLPPTSLNRPTGPQRRLDVVAADLAAVRDLGHAHGGTVNDVILAVIAGALRALLASRGEELDQVTASVPVSARRAATGGQLGNQVGVMPVALPASGDLAARVTRIAAITRQRKTAARGTSAALLGPPFRLLAPTGLLRWFFYRQRLIHTFATNLRGPAEPLTFGGAPVRAVIRSQPGAGPGRADGRPAPGTGQRGPLTGAADGSLGSPNRCGAPGGGTPARIASRSGASRLRNPAGTPPRRAGASGGYRRRAGPARARRAPRGAA